MARFFPCFCAPVVLFFTFLCFFLDVWCGCVETCVRHQRWQLERVIIQPYDYRFHVLFLFHDFLTKSLISSLSELPIETRGTAVSRRSPLSPSSSLSSSAERHLRINKLSVPESVENGTKKFVILDCDYDVNERVDKKLVIKWFFNDDPVPIYQWIPELNIRTTSPKFTDRIDLSYSVPGGSPLTKYRAVKLLKPTISDSGRYSCNVASLFSQDSQEKSMHVYGRCL